MARGYFIVTLQSALDAKTASDTAVIKTRDVLSSLIMIIINDEITLQSNRIDLDIRTKKTQFTFKADIKNEKSPIEIIQSDGTRVILADLQGALTDSGYKISTRTIKSSRVGTDDRVKLQVSWD